MSLKKEGLLIIILLANSVFACVDLVDNAVYSSDMNVCNKAYFLDNGLKIHGNNILFDCNHGVIRGDFFKNSGITIINSENITIKNCNVMFYDIGINVQNSRNVVFDEDTRLIRNHYGSKFFNSENNFVAGIDVSLKSPIKLAASRDNLINFFNKRVDESLCSDSECNRPFWLLPFQMVLR